MSLLVRSVPTMLALALVASGCSSAANSVSGTTDSSQQPGGGTAPHSSRAEVTRVFDEVPAIDPSVDGYGTALVVLTSPDGSRWELPVLLADERPEQTHGLMEVSALPDGTGMLFTFAEDRAGNRGFWMKGTLIDLDIVYVRASGEPVAALTMVTCDETCPSYPPGATYRFTVEFPAGYLDRIGFDLQWRVEAIV